MILAVLYILFQSQSYIIEDIGGLGDVTATGINAAGLVCATEERPWGFSPLLGPPGRSIGHGGLLFDLNTTTAVGQGPDLRPWSWPSAAALLAEPFTGAARGINGAGDTCGEVLLRPGDPASRAAFALVFGTFYILPPNSIAYGINDFGVVCGATYDPEGRRARAFLWTPGNPPVDCGGGSFFALNSPTEREPMAVGVSAGLPVFWRGGQHQLAGGPGEARAVNRTYAIVGLISGEGAGPLSSYAALWPDPASPPVDLNAAIAYAPDRPWSLLWASGINDRGEICGVGLHGGHLRAFRLRPT